MLTRSPSPEQIDEVTLRNYRNLASVSKLLFNSEVTERLGYRCSPWKILRFLKTFGHKVGRMYVIRDTDLNRLDADGEIERFMDALSHRKARKLYGSEPQPRPAKGAGKRTEPADEHETV